MLGLVLLALLVAAFGLAFALVLDFAKPAMPWKRRALIAALGAGFIPSLPAFFAIGSELGAGKEGVIALSAIFVLALFLSLVIGFPVAYSVTRQSESRHNPPVRPDVFE